MQSRLRLISQHLSLPPKPTSPFQRAMSSFILPNSNPDCPVNLPQSLTEDQLLSFRAFKDWLATLQKSLSDQQSKDHAFHSSPYSLRNIDIQAVDIFGGARIGFIKLKAEIANDNGEKLPGSVFLRGGSVAMLARLPAAATFSRGRLTLRIATTATGRRFIESGG